MKVVRLQELCIGGKINKNQIVGILLKHFRNSENRLGKPAIDHIETVLG